MWLTRVVCGARSVTGKQWIGKYRRAVKMTATKRKTLREKESRVAEVTALLSQPYLFQSEEMGVASDRKRQYVPPWVRARRKKWMRREEEVFTELQGGSGTH